MPYITTLQLNFSGRFNRGDLPQYTHAEGLLAELPRFPHLQHLWLRVHVRVDRYGIAAEPCTTLATVLPLLPHLSSLELFAEFVFGFHGSDLGSSAIASVVEAALTLPCLPVLHITVAVVEGGQEHMVTALVKAAAFMHLSLDMYLYDEWRWPGVGDNQSSRLTETCKCAFMSMH